MAHNELPVPVFESNEFAWIAPVTGQGTGGLVAEASSLNGWKLGRLWNDSCDEGVAIRSNRTGKIERFYLDSTSTRDGDLQAWHLLPVNRNLTMKVTVFND